MTRFSPDYKKKRKENISNIQQVHITGYSASHPAILNVPHALLLSQKHDVTNLSKNTN